MKMKTYGMIQERIEAGEFVGEEEVLRLCAKILCLHVELAEDAGYCRDLLIRSDLTLAQISDLICDVFGLSDEYEHHFRGNEEKTVGDWLKDDRETEEIYHLYYSKEEDGSMRVLTCGRQVDAMYEEKLGWKIRKRTAMLKDMPLEVVPFVFGIDPFELEEDKEIGAFEHLRYTYGLRMGFVFNLEVKQDCVDLEGVVEQDVLDDAVLGIFDRKPYVLLYEKGRNILEECETAGQFLSFAQAFENKDVDAIAFARRYRWR